MTEILRHRNNVLLFAYKGARVDNINVREVLREHIQRSVKQGALRYVVFARDATSLSDMYYIIASEIINKLKESNKSITLVAIITSNVYADRLREIKKLNLYDNIEILTISGTYTNYLAQLISAGIFQEIVCYLATDTSVILKAAKLHNIQITNIYEFIYPYFLDRVDDEVIKIRYRELKDQESKILEMIKYDLPMKKEFLRYRDIVELLLRKWDIC